MAIAELERHVVHDLVPNPDGKLVDVNGRGFDPVAYSRMKRGDLSQIGLYADAIFSTLDGEAHWIIQSSIPPGVIVAYESTPNPATILAQHTLNLMNARRAELDLPLGHIVKIEAEDYEEPYSHLSVDERKKILRKQSKTLRVDKKKLKGVRPVIIDDIFVTGQTEGMLLDFLAQYTSAFIAACYVAKFDGATAVDSPELEGVLDNAEANALPALYVPGRG